MTTMSNQVPEWALTLWRPRPYAILLGGKRIENRTYPPPKTMIGKTFAIHAGCRWDSSGVRFLKKNGLWVPEHDKDGPECRELYPAGAIVGYARLVRDVTESSDPYFVGPHGWVIDEVVMLDRPYKIRGFQGFWPIPESDRRFGLAQIRAYPVLGDQVGAEP